VTSKETTADAVVPQPKEAGGHALRYCLLAEVLGVILVVAGLVAGSISYDERFINDSPDPIWDIISWLAFAFAVVGVLLVPISLVGAVVVGIARAVRRARGR
jgi:hypothetical protein